MPVSVKVLVCELLQEELGRSIDLEGLADADLMTYFEGPGTNDLPSILERAAISGGPICVICTTKDLPLLGDLPSAHSVIAATNCAELLTGPGLSSSLMSRGAYLITPAILRRWRKAEEGAEPSAHELGVPMNTTEIILLDAGLGDWSKADLDRLSAQVGIPASAVFVGLDFLRLRLACGSIEARLRWELEEAKKESTTQARMRSDYALAFDLLERISRGTEEERVAGSIIDVLNMLFSPGGVEYFAIDPEGGLQLFDYENGRFASVDGGTIPSLLQGANHWDDASNGFKLKVEHKGKVLAIARLWDLSFPELNRDYLNLASQLSVVFGLAVANARAFRSLKDSEAQVERAFALESTMLSISQGFFGRPDFDRAVNEALARVGEAVGCSRVLLLQRSRDMTAMACTHEWASHGTSSIKGQLANIPADLQAWLTENAHYEGTVRAVDLSLVSQGEKGLLSPLLEDGVSSMLMSPVLVEGRMHGLACLQRTGEDRTWEPDEASMLRFLVQNLSVALQRKKAQEDMASLAESVTMSNKVLRHDIRNELMVLSGSLQLYDMKKEEKQLDRAKRSAVRLTEILDHFKELDSFLQSSKALFPIDLREVIVQVMTTHQVVYEVQGDAQVLADFALNSVIDNLVRNARRHGEATNVKFAITRDGGAVRLTVADNGKGIPEAARPKLFQEGFSYGEKRSTGLGLFWVRKTMERYGGFASLVPSDKGAKFLLGFSSA